MTESIKSSAMLVINILLALLVLASGFFLFSSLMGDVTEQRQTDEYIMLAGEISKLCQEIKLNPNNLFTTDQFSIMIYEPYVIWYENPTSYGTDQVCKNERCVCFGRISGKAKPEVPSDCFSLKELDCPAGANLTITPRGYSTSPMFGVPRAQGIFSAIHEPATCKYIAKIKWDKTNLFVNVTDIEPMDKKSEFNDAC